MGLGARKILAEVIGTAALVFMGLAAAMTNGFGIGFVGIALVFGLVLTAMAYSIGNISGAHINPAVSLGMLIDRRITGAEFIQYVIAQIIGALIGAGLIRLIFGHNFIANHGMGQNFYGVGQPVNLGAGGAFAVEVILTFIFVITVLGVTSMKGDHAVTGLVVGAALALVHFVGLPLTGTSVNPARSLAPALFVGGTALHQVWLFILAPLVGGALAALAYRALKGGDQPVEDPAPGVHYVPAPVTVVSDDVVYAEPGTTIIS